MPTYSWKCTECMVLDETFSKIPGENNKAPNCPVCGVKMRRNYAGEMPITNFHMTRDLYAQKKRADARRSGT